MHLATVQRKLPAAGAETPFMRILSDHFVCADEATIAAIEAGARMLQLDAGEVLFRQASAGMIFIWFRFDEMVGTSREQAGKKLAQMSDRELTAYR